jgi:hypothetical protein
MLADGDQRTHGYDCTYAVKGRLHGPSGGMIIDSLVVHP